jgi:hypothetical protein
MDPAAMTELDQALAAVLDYYDAFNRRDLVAMDRIWARQAPVTCLHPGWTPLCTRDAIMESYREILDNPDAPRIDCFDERAFLQGTAVVVICEESLQAGSLVATNIFIEEAGGWYMVHHQAGPIVRRRPEPSRRPVGGGDG